MIHLTLIHIIKDIARLIYTHFYIFQFTENKNYVCKIFSSFEKKFKIKLHYTLLLMLLTEHYIVQLKFAELLVRIEHCKKKIDNFREKLIP